MISADLPLDAAAFRAAMGRLPTGVVVVTTRCDGATGDGGCADGVFDHVMTANSFTSVSLDPLLVLVCVENATRFAAAMSHQEHWAVSVLPAGAHETARWFATPGRPLSGQLDRVGYHRGALTGAALLDDALVTVECRTTLHQLAGDHTIMVGQVLSLHTPDPDGQPLVFWRGQFGTTT